MKTTIALTLPALCLLLTACSTSTGLAPRTIRSGFDNNARVVRIEPHAAAPKGPMDVIHAGIGAEWHETKPDDVILIITVFNEITGISGAELNIDGDKMTLPSLDLPTDMDPGDGIMKKSSRPFFTSLGTVDRIIKSKRTWIRVQTPTGSLENAVIDGPTDSKAYHALIRFMDAVNGGQNSLK
jgi:hypothetical protein